MKASGYRILQPQLGIGKHLAAADRKKKPEYDDYEDGHEDGIPELSLIHI